MTDLKMLGLYNTGLNPENMIFPEKKGIRELSITEWAEISDINLAEFPLFEYLVLSNNAIENIDLSKAPSALKTASLANNSISSVKLGNPQMWGLDHKKTDCRQSKGRALPLLNSCCFSGNMFAEIDLSPVASTLSAPYLV